MANFIPLDHFQAIQGQKMSIWSNIGVFLVFRCILSNFKGKNHFSKILHFLVFFKANLATLRHFRAIRRGINYFRAFLEPFKKEFAFFLPF